MHRRLNDYLGGKMLSQGAAGECRAYVKERDEAGGTRAIFTRTP